MPDDTSRPTRRWVRVLASLAVATAGLTTVAGATGVIGPASPASACCFEPRHPDEEAYRVRTYDGIGNYDYEYESGRVREYRNYTFIREYYRRP
jgi:hypothetical protein